MKSQETSTLTLRRQLNQNLSMLRAAIRRPKEVSTIFPTSPALARALLQGHSFKKAELVVELGPGTGAITRPLQPRLPRRTEYLGVELVPSLVKTLRKEFPKLNFVQDSAVHLDRILGQRQADSIVSSIPWTLLNPEVQEDLLEAIVGALKPGGIFSTYVCLNAAWYPAAKNLKYLLARSFPSMQKSPIVWANIPPAFVYTCRKPLDS